MPRKGGLDSMTEFPNLNPDPIGDLLAAAEALEALSRRPDAEPEREQIHAAARRRLDRAVEHLRDMGAPEREILALLERG